MERFYFNPLAKKMSEAGLMAITGKYNWNIIADRVKKELYIPALQAEKKLFIGWRILILMFLYPIYLPMLIYEKLRYGNNKSL